jgi:M3 family oligoendopeptidase
MQATKFSEYQYQRPDAESLERSLKLLIEQIKGEVDLGQLIKLIDAFNQLRNEYAAQNNICYIRHTIDTTDGFYNAENDFFDAYNPIFASYVTQFYAALIEHPLRKELELQLGAQLFRIAEISLKTFDPSIIEDLQEENKLSSEYTKLKATAELVFEGKTYNLSSIVPLNLARNRAVRKRSNEVKWEFYAKNEQKIDDILDRLIKVRHKIALKLGYSNFIELGYDRMLRTDYNAAMVAGYREEIAKHMVPLVTSLFKKQGRNTKLEEVFYYDEDFHFIDGNPTPKGDAEYILEAASQMYHELSAETDAFFTMMKESNLMDLVAREGKATGGYCTYIETYKTPFIFSNFNGTSGDIDVLTHEAGHAFQVYSSRNHAIPEYNWPTYEACEIHSMSMEFFTWPWMKLFFGEDTRKYYYAHLTNALMFLPYGAAVDEFQHEIYGNIDYTAVDRKAAWQRIERKYLPHRNNEENTFLQHGNFWQKQNHIFNSPFYYIDYTLAQICALHYWHWSAVDKQAAWASYVKLCALGGKFSFTELLEKAGLESPFESGSIEKVLVPINEWLEAYDFAADAVG